jgi:hypothetical protein
LNELQDEFYGKEEDDFEGGVFEDNYECAEWSRDNMDTLFNTIDRLIKELESKNAQLSEANDLLGRAHDLLDNIHGYDTDVYRDISTHLYGEDEDE